jgi:hypothetical protein
VLHVDNNKRVHVDTSLLPTFDRHFGRAARAARPRARIFPPQPRPARIAMTIARAETESSPAAAAACKPDKRARQRSPEMAQPSGACPCLFGGGSRAQPA